MPTKTSVIEGCLIGQGLVLSFLTAICIANLAINGVLVARPSPSSSPSPSPSPQMTYLTTQVEEIAHTIADIQHMITDIKINTAPSAAADTTAFTNFVREYHILPEYTKMTPKNNIICGGNHSFKGKIYQTESNPNVFHINNLLLTGECSNYQIDFRLNFGNQTFTAAMVQPTPIEYHITVNSASYVWFDNNTVLSLTLSTVLYDPGHDPTTESIEFGIVARVAA